jgi:hypothetical protein
MPSTSSPASPIRTYPRPPVPKARGAAHPGWRHPAACVRDGERDGTRTGTQTATQTGSLAYDIDVEVRKANPYTSFIVKGWIGQPSYTATGALA